MKLTEEIRPGTNRYISQAGAVATLPALAAGFKHPIIVTGEQSFAVFQAHAAKLPWAIYRYDGTASDEDAQRIANVEPDADLVIAIGGGRLLDTAKVVAEDLHAAVITVPTLASNCAPYTPIGAIYNPDHSFKRVAYFTQAPFATVVDWNLIMTTPHDYFVAGIGDTLAKWYEMAGLTKSQTLPVFSRLAAATAKTILDTLQESAVAALNDLDAHQLTAAFTDVADCIMGIAGDVGGFGVADGRQAGAHAIHNGLSFLPESHALLHGSKVAYGILVQLAHTQELDEIRSLMPFYHQVGLPTSLKDLGITQDSDQKVALIAQHAASSEESFTLIDPKITPKQVIQDIATVEETTQG